MDRRRCSVEPDFTETYQEHLALRRTLKERLHRNWAPRRVSNRIITASTSIYRHPRERSQFLFLLVSEHSVRAFPQSFSPSRGWSVAAVVITAACCNSSPQPLFSSPPPPSAKLSGLLRSSRLLTILDTAGIPLKLQFTKPGGLSVSGGPLSTAGTRLYRFTFNCNYY